jgi:hypothetical protein
MAYPLSNAIVIESLECSALVVNLFCLEFSSALRTSEAVVQVSYCEMQITWRAFNLRRKIPAVSLMNGTPSQSRRYKHEDG